MTADQELKVTRGPLIILDHDMRVRRVNTGSSVSSHGCSNAPRNLLRPSLEGKGLDRNFVFGPVVLGLFSKGGDVDLPGLSPWATSCLSLNKFDTML